LEIQFNASIEVVLVHVEAVSIRLETHLANTIQRLDSKYTRAQRSVVDET
jgi:hypothetical protein